MQSIPAPEPLRRVSESNISLSPLGALFNSWQVVEEVVPPGCCFPPLRIAPLVILLTLSGKARTADSLGFADNQPNSLLLLPAGTTITEKVGPHKKWHIRYLLVSGGAADHFQNMFWNKGEPRMILVPNPPPPWTALLSEIVTSTFDHHPNWDWRSMSLIADLFSQLLASPRDFGNPKSLSDRAKAIVLSNTRKAWSLAELATAMHVSTSLLAHEFKEQCGESPAAWIRKTRIALAERLLKQGIGVATVSESLGYSNPFHFSRAFYETLGIRPSRVMPTSESPLHQVRCERDTRNG